jgi:DNA-binding LacI/PurR family transcriptional regulator
VVRHLAALGHRRVAHLAAPGTPVGDARREGFEDEARWLGLEAVIVPAGLTEEAGRRAGREALRLDPRPTALFAVNDMAAFGALSAAEDLGLRVPEDVSLAGYDDTPAARLRAVGLTSVDNASREAGRVAAALLARRIAAGSRGPGTSPAEEDDGGGEPPAVVLLTPELKARTSTAQRGRLRREDVAST